MCFKFLFHSICRIIEQIASIIIRFLKIYHYPNNFMVTSLKISTKKIVFFFKIVKTQFSVVIIKNVFAVSFITIPLNPS